MPRAQTAQSIGSFCSSFFILSAQLDVAQQLVALARDLVLDERAAARAMELPEHRPVVDIAPPVADVGIGGGDLGVVLDAVLLVVARDRPEIGRALGAADPLAPQV